MTYKEIQEDIRSTYSECIMKVKGFKQESASQLSYKHMRECAVYGGQERKIDLKDRQIEIDNELNEWKVQNPKATKRKIDQKLTEITEQHPEYNYEARREEIEDLIEKQVKIYKNATPDADEEEIAKMREEIIRKYPKTNEPTYSTLITASFKRKNFSLFQQPEFKIFKNTSDKREIQRRIVGEDVVLNKYGLPNIKSIVEVDTLPYGYIGVSMEELLKRDILFT